MQVKIVKPGKKVRDFGAVSVEDGATVAQLKLAFEKATRISRFRQNFKLQQGETLVSLTDDKKSLKEYGVKNNTQLLFKDLGPQIGYRTVFVIEYLGPLVFVLLYAMRPAFLYGAGAASKPFDPTAWLGVVCWTAHFCKREFETVFVHRFSHPTMPLFNLFKNCAHYWIFALVVGYPLCHPDYTAPASELQIKLGFALFVVSEFLNLCVHLQLRNLRPAEGSKERPIPKGPLFALVSCPNYTFEILGWVGFSLFTQIFFSYAFTLVGFLQMADWALKKQRGYNRTYGDEFKKLRRKALIPFVF